MNGRGIAGRAWVRWTFGVALPIGCFAYALVPNGYLPTDGHWPRAAVLAWAATSLVAMAWSTRRRGRGSAPSLLLGGLLVCGALFALAHTLVMAGEILAVVFFPILWVFLPFALAPPIALVVYTACAIDELARASAAPRASLAPLLIGLALPVALTMLAAGAVRGTETLLLARLVEPEVDLDPRELAPLRAIGWLDRWSRIQSVRSQWMREDPPAYRGRTLRARQVLHALTGKFGSPPPGAD